MLKRAAKVAKRARSEIGHVKFIRMTPFDGMMEQWNGGIFYNTECLIV